MSEYTQTLSDDPLAGRAEGRLRRRHHRRRRTRTLDGVPPRDPPRHHERGGPRGRLHRARATPGRNTTIIRANYGIPEAIRFYQHSLELYQGLEAETGAAILHQTKGILWLAHTEMAMRTERARCLHQHGLRRDDRDGHAGRGQGARARRST